MIEIIIGIIVLVLALILIMFNTLTRLKINVKETKTSIDIYLQQRFDLIPNLVNCIKGYMKHEKEILET